MRSRALALLVFCCGLALSVAVALALFAESRRNDEARFDAAVDRLAGVLKERAERYVLDFQRFTDAIDRSEEITKQVWDMELDRLSPTGRLPALVELFCATNPALPNVEFVTRRAQQAHSPHNGYFSLSRVKPGELKALHQWKRLTKVEPQATEAWLETPPVKERWVATWNGHLSSAPTRIIPGENGGQIHSVALFFSLFAPDVKNFAEGYPHVFYRHFLDHRFEGLIAASIDWNSFVSNALPGQRRDVDFEAYSDEKISPETWMGPAGAAPKALDEGFSPRFAKTVEWRFFRRKWLLYFFTKPAFQAASQESRGWFALSGGALLSALMAAVVATQTRAREEQQRVAAQLRRSLEDLEAARAERERLNHDLHDATIQSLYAVQLSLGSVASRLDAADPESAGRIEQAERNIVGVIGEVRNFISRDEIEDEQRDLGSVIETFANSFGGATGIAIDVSIDAEASARISPEQAVNLANLAREALSNAVKHAGAKRISVALRASGGAVLLEISDDGIGMNVAACAGRGMGLTSLRARAKAAGGECGIESAPGKGTAIRVTCLLRAGA